CGGQIGHLGRVGRVVREVVRGELLGTEAGKPELLDLLGARGGRKVCKMHRRLAALRTRELQQRAPLGVLLLRPALGPRTHLRFSGTRRADGGGLSHVSRVRGDRWEAAGVRVDARSTSSVGSSIRSSSISAPATADASV